MIFTVYDYNEYVGTLSFTTEDYETDIDVDVSRAWDEEKEEWNDNIVKEIAETEISKKYPGAIVEW